MNVVAHGIDLVIVAELGRLIDDPRALFLPRTFTRDELDEIGDTADKMERLAGRFAAKEAVLKALGTGFGGGVGFSDVVIHRPPGSPPQILLSGGAANAASCLGIQEWLLSITHAGSIAMASALALGCPHCDSSDI
ncbi:MAG: holo-[acyl-carrier-protein] synthase [Gammaproteobacteria bacterium]|nr:holo-[acyl-carrier-protein] synthase [Gammaproteobacteria bacterium]